MAAKRELFVNSVRTVPIDGLHVTPTAIRYEAFDRAGKAAEGGGEYRHRGAAHVLSMSMQGSFTRHASPISRASARVATTRSAKAHPSNENRWAIREVGSFLKPTQTKESDP